jgi:hypothetical protein
MFDNQQKDKLLYICIKDFLFEYVTDFVFVSFNSNTNGH